MKKIILIALCIFYTLPANAGLYDDILNPADNPYKNCKDRACIELLHQEHTQALNSLDAAYLNQMLLNSQSITQPQQIRYGYNSVGNYVPLSIGNQRIDYGYNDYGQFVPISIGGQ